MGSCESLKNKTAAGNLKIFRCNKRNRAITTANFYELGKWWSPHTIWPGRLLLGSLLTHITTNTLQTKRCCESVFTSKAKSSFFSDRLLCLAWETPSSDKSPLREIKCKKKNYEIWTWIPKCHNIKNEEFPWTLWLSLQFSLTTGVN